MPEINEDVRVTFYAGNLRLNTSVEKSTITIEDIQLSEDQGATLSYLINNSRNILEAEIRLIGRFPL